MSRPEKIKCDGCGREVLLENATDWIKHTAQPVEPVPLLPMSPAQAAQFGGVQTPEQMQAAMHIGLAPGAPQRLSSATGEACSPKCDTAVIKELRKQLEPPPAPKVQPTPELVQPTTGVVGEA